MRSHWEDIKNTWGQGCSSIRLWLCSWEGTCCPTDSWPRPRVGFLSSIIFLGHRWYGCWLTFSSQSRDIFKAYYSWKVAGPGIFKLEDLQALLKVSCFFFFTMIHSYLVRFWSICSWSLSCAAENHTQSIFLDYQSWSVFFLLSFPLFEINSNYL